MNKKRKINLDEKIDAKITDDNIEREIRCVKNIKRKIQIKMIIAVLMSVLVTIIIIHIFNPYIIIKNEDGKYILYNTNTGNIEESKYGINIIANYTEKYMGRDIEHYMVFTFDKNDKCINCRKRISGYKEKDMNNYKSTWENSVTTSNMEIRENKLYFNENTFIGKSKDKVLSYLKEVNAEIMEI